MRLTDSSRRITAAWCKKHDVPIEKLFSKTLLTKCTFNYLHKLALVLILCHSPLGIGGRRRVEVLSIFLPGWTSHSTGFRTYTASPAYIFPLCYTSSVLSVSVASIYIAYIFLRDPTRSVNVHPLASASVPRTELTRGMPKTAVIECGTRSVTRVDHSVLCTPIIPPP